MGRVGVRELVGGNPVFGLAGFDFAVGKRRQVARFDAVDAEVAGAAAVKPRRCDHSEFNFVIRQPIELNSVNLTETVKNWQVEHAPLQCAAPVVGCERIDCLSQLRFARFQRVAFCLQLCETLADFI